MKSDEKNIEDTLKRHLPLPSQEETEADCNRVWTCLQSRAADRVQQASLTDSAFLSKPNWRRLALVYAAAAVLLTVSIGTAIVWRRSEDVAVVEHVDRSSYRVVEGQAQPISVRDKLEIGETVRTPGGPGAVFSLADGSSIEIRSDSELSLERADDGIRVHLTRGGVIVNAAKQHQRHLYVQTKDVIVSVLGTVFLVNAEEEGSSVAVIQGEVQVHRGTVAQQLLPGEQVATSPLMAPVPVKEGISWSRNAEAHLALLQQSAFVPTTTVRQNSIQPLEAFEVASVRPSAEEVPGGGVRGGRGPGGCSGGVPPQIDPKRFSGTHKYLYTLITYAYFADYGTCSNVSVLDLLSGGPAWVKSEMFDIEASIPEGVFSTAPTLRDPKLQRMLQTLLADRFKLVVRRNTKEMPVYAMTLARDASGYAASNAGAPWLTRKPDDWPAQLNDRQGLVAQEKGPTAQSPVWIGTVYGANASMAELAPLLGRLTSRPILDRTDLAGKFNFYVEYSPDSPPNNSPVGGPLNPAERASLIVELEKQAGIKLEMTRAPVEFLVIEHAEKPSEN